MHLCLDLETLGNQPTSVITQISLVPFSIRTGEIKPRPGLPSSKDQPNLDIFNKYVDIQSCLNAGLTVNGSTIKWWMKQSPEAQQACFDSNNEVPLSVAIEEMYIYLKRLKSEAPEEALYLWCHATFDYPILKYAASKITYEDLPIPFRNVRDLRTIVHLAEIDVKSEYIDTLPVGAMVAHNAVDDCKFQIRYLVDAWRKLEVWRGRKIV